MNRREELKRFVDKSSLGIEVAPYFNPIVAKSDGYNVLVLDVFDTERLLKNAKGDPKINDADLAKIEAVDLVTDASQLAAVVNEKELSGKVQYIVSSHNFEHLPDPISFLKGCSEALVPGGVLTMAVPDCRACFDHFRMPTRLSDWLAAYHGGYTQPSPETLFDFSANQAPCVNANNESISFNISSDRPIGFTPVRQLKSAYADYVAEREVSREYQDAHCSTFFGASLELMLHDLRHLGLTDLEVIEISDTNVIEFYVHLRKPLDTNAPAESDAIFYQRRHKLMIEVNRQLGTLGLASNLKPFSLRRIFKVVFGHELAHKLRAINTRRRIRRRVKKRLNG